MQTTNNTYYKASHKHTARIVILDDDLYYNKLLTKFVSSICNPYESSSLHFEIKSYCSAEVCLREFNPNTDIMLLDYYLKSDFEEYPINGLDVLKTVKEINPEIKVLMMSSQDNVLLTVELMKAGIYDYVDKNVSTRQRVGSLLQQIIKTNYTLKK